MTRAAGIYERELRELLRGETAAVRRYAHRLAPQERPIVESFARRPFLVVRAAGSLGFDLVALRPEFAFPLEVKSSTEATIRFSAASGRANAQLEAHRKAVEQVGLLVVYAFRRVGGDDRDTWRLFSTGGERSEGRLRLLRRFLPPVARTPEGNGVLRWEDGKPLLEFLKKVEFLTDPAPIRVDP
ncbi:MAG: Holliday junction resolvase [Thermoplasmata archaeon]|nr:Holliday junction resolvase [Thermoplasmata archaeon]